MFASPLSRIPIFILNFEISSLGLRLYIPLWNMFSAWLKTVTDFTQSKKQPVHYSISYSPLGFLTQNRKWKNPNRKQLLKWSCSSFPTNCFQATWQWKHCSKYLAFKKFLSTWKTIYFEMISIVTHAKILMVPRDLVLRDQVNISTWHRIKAFIWNKVFNSVPTYICETEIETRKGYWEHQENRELTIRSRPEYLSLLRLRKKGSSGHNDTEKLAKGLLQTEQKCCNHTVESNALV